MLAVAFFLPSPLPASKPKNRFFIGPETYHVCRTREGGTKQDGWLFGGRFICDHFYRYHFYWAVEGALAGGSLGGKSGQKVDLKSKMCEGSIEARFGYTFQCKYGCRWSLTPFVGVGYYQENNRFKKPKSLPLHFETSYRYLTAGFLFSICFQKDFSLGVNLKIRHMMDPKCKISNDPENLPTCLSINNEALQYRIELPLMYRLNCYSFVAMPFYEIHDYGRKAGFPFDFLRTRYHNYGVTLLLGYFF